jgi:hypothetical protein
MSSKEARRLIGVICVENQLPAGSPPWLAGHIGGYATDVGDFSFIKGKLSRDLLESGYKAVTEADGWKFLKEFTPPADCGFMFCPPTPELTRINTAISKYYDGHSGASYGWTMRCMEMIAKNGWDFFKTRMTSD